jgi:hypothetical protein
LAMAASDVEPVQVCDPALVDRVQLNWLMFRPTRATARINSRSYVLMFCTECGKQVDQGKNFCGNCGGARVVKATEPIPSSTVDEVQTPASAPTQAPRAASEGLSAPRTPPIAPVKEGRGISTSMPRRRSCAYRRCWGGHLFRHRFVAPTGQAGARSRRAGKSSAESAAGYGGRTENCQRNK